MRQRPPQDPADNAARRARMQVTAFARHPDLEASAWLTLTEVLDYVPVSRRAWYRGIQSGMFPAPHKVGRLSFWKARDIRALLEQGPRRPRSPRGGKARPLPPDGPGPGYADVAQALERTHAG